MPGQVGYISLPAYFGDPGGVVAYALQERGVANEYLLKLGEASAGLTPPVIEAEFPATPSSPVLTATAPPSLEAIVWTAPNAPAAFTGAINIDDLLPAPFEDSPPDLIFGAVPTFDGAAPDAPAVDFSYTTPDLTLTLPAAPALLSLNIASFNGLDLPTIDTTVPQLTVVAPSIREYIPGAQYTSALLTDLRARLDAIIQGSDTGLGSDAENAIWDRGREREARSRRDALDELNRMEELGFSFAPGIYLDARLKIITEADANDRGLSREILIKEAELEQANVHHAIDAAMQLERSSMEYSNQVEQRLFDSSKYATEAGIQIYNAQVQAYAAYLDAFKARIAIYDAQIRGELAKVDAYKAQIEAEQAKADVNRVLVENYKVQTDVALSAIEIFKARIGAIQAKAEIEKSKIEMFGEQVRAYATTVNAYTAGVEGYRATIQAEATKQDAFRAKVDAYSARVGAAAKSIDAKVAAFKGNIDAYTAQLEGYRATISGESARVQAVASVNTNIADLYRAEVSGISSYNTVLTGQWDAAVKQADAVAQIGIQAAKANADLYMTTRSLALDAAKVGAQVSAQLGAAALNAITWSSTMHNANSASNSYGGSESDSTSTSDDTRTSVSQETIYNYNV